MASTASLASLSTRASIHDESSGSTSEAYSAGRTSDGKKQVQVGDRVKIVNNSKLLGMVGDVKSFSVQGKQQIVHIGLDNRISVKFPVASVVVEE